MDDIGNHHAYALAGQREDLIPRLLFLLEKKAGYRVRGNPDFRSETFDVFGVDEARELKEAAYRKAVSGGKKVFVISAQGITKEAQNALLKVVEEPPEDTQFFLVVPSLHILLPTLHSRLYILSGVSGNETKKDFALAEDFLKSPIPKRLKTVQGMLKAAEEETGKQRLAAFLDDLERYLAGKERGTVAEALAEVLEAKKYSRDRSPSFKLLLEHLALVMPRVR